MESESYHMSQKELHRLPVIEAVCAKQVVQMEAAESLGLSTRQVRRLQRRLQAEGPAGLKHRSRGRPSNHRHPPEFRSRVLGLIRQKYPDFGPTLACEKLAQAHRIRLSDETLREWMRAEGLLAGRRRPRPHRQWRERRACYGQMVQMDGSHHDWLEGRGPKLVLMGYIDDATSRIYGRFYDSEDLPAALDSFKRYCRVNGIPQSVYLDKHTIYRSPGPTNVQNQLEGKVTQSQFERALSELGVNVIHANSPQAKGRVERLFKTLQDRLGLARVKSLEQANRFLQGFLVCYNRRFARSAQQPGNLHRRVHAGIRLEQILCVKEPRVVANDGTIRINRQRLQLIPQDRLSLAQRRVTVTISPQGRMRVLCDGTQELPYRSVPISPRPEPKPREPDLPRTWSRGIPAANHPWRQYELTRRLKTLKA